MGTRMLFVGIAALCVQWLSCLGMCAERQQVVLKNGGFEAAAIQIAAGYEQEFGASKGGSRFERTEEAPHEGKYACRVHLEQQLAWLSRGRPGWARASFSFSQNTEAMGGKRVTLEFQVRLNTDLGRIWPMVLLYDEKDQQIGGSKAEKKMLIANQAGKWQKVDLEFGVPANARKMTAIFWGFGPLGKTYDLDDVRLFIEKPPVMKLSYSEPPLLPVPKQVTWQESRFDLKTVQNVVYYASPGGYEKDTATKIKKYIGRYAANIGAIEEGGAALPYTHAIVLGSLKNASFVEAMSKKPELLEALKAIKTKGEGYVLELAPKGLTVLAGQDGAGAYYAFRTLLQLIRFDPDRIPQGVIVDWPDHPRRIFLSLATHKAWQTPRRQRDRSWEAMERGIFEILAANRYNELTLMCNRWVFKYEDGDNTKLNYAGMGVPKEKLKKIIQYANENFITVIPGLNNHCKSEWLLRGYPKLREPSAIPWTACTKHPEFYPALFSAMKEVYEVFGQQTAFMIGHDEIRFLKGRLRACPFCKDTPKWEIVAEDISKQAEYLRTLGVSEVRVWTDMLLETWNGGPPFNIARTRDKLPKDLVVPQHWLGEDGTLISGEPFFQSGFKKIIWCPTEEVTSGILPKDVSRYQAIGMNKCGGDPMWHVWCRRGNKAKGGERSYRNFQVVFRTGNLLWNAKHRDTHTSFREFPYVSGTSLMRYTSARTIGSNIKYTPLTLPGRVDISSAWQLPGWGFDFSRIKTQIETSRFKSLYNDGRAIRLADGNANAAATDSSSASIAVKRKCRALAVLHALHLPESRHAAFLKKSQRRSVYEGIEVGQYVLVYADGAKASKTIGIGYNIFFVQHPHFHRSLLLWDASEVWTVPYEKPFVTSVLVIANPHPDKEVTQVRVEKTVAGPELAVFAVAASK